VAVLKHQAGDFQCSPPTEGLPLGEVHHSRGGDQTLHYAFITLASLVLILAYAVILYLFNKNINILLFFISILDLDFNHIF